MIALFMIISYTRSFIPRLSGSVEVIQLSTNKILEKNSLSICTCIILIYV